MTYTENPTLTKKHQNFIVSTRLVSPTFISIILISEITLHKYDNFIIIITSNTNFNQFNNNQKTQIVFIYAYNYRGMSQQVFISAEIREFNNTPKYQLLFLNNQTQNIQKI
jgi:hypothetical protein